MGDSIVDKIGRRPTGYSFGQGLGTALMGGGQYFGELAIQKKNAEALAEARGYDEKIRNEALTRESELRKEDRELLLLDRGTARAQDLADRQLDTARQDQLLADANARADAEDTESDAEIARVVDRTNPETGEVEQWGVDSMGNDVKKLGDNPDYGVDVDGQSIRKSSGNKADTAKAATERQGNLEMYAENMNAALEGMGQVIGEGYEVDGGRAFFDQLAGSVGVAGNWAKSPQGRQFALYQSLGVESFQKALSGAAGSDAESMKYQVLFPAPGDDVETTRVKATVLKGVITRMKKASGQYSGKQLGEYMGTQLVLEAAKSGLDLESGKSFGAASTTTSDWSPDEQSLIDFYSNN